MARTRSVTQTQIAEQLGISQAAVSSILSGSERLSVGPETRLTVLRLAEKLGYTPPKGRKRQAAARKDLGSLPDVLLVDSQPEAVSSGDAWLAAPYQALMGRLVTASERCLRQQSIGLKYIHFDGADELMRRVAAMKIGGVLWHAVEADSALLHWIASRVPLVLLNREWVSATPFDSVRVDQGLNVFIAADRLWNAGHRRIATFGHVPSSSIHQRRMEAYTKFVKERQLRNYKEFQELSDEISVAPAEKVRAMLDLWTKLGDDAPTGLITSDKFALSMIPEARKAGIRIPEDLSLVGIDNTSACDFVDPTLTSMDEPFEEMCRVAVELLVRRAGEPEASSQSVQIAPRLVERNSVAQLDAASA